MLSQPFTIGLSRSLSLGIPFWTIVEHGARERARELGARLAVYMSRYPHEEIEAIRRLTQQRVDLLIVAAMNPASPPFLEALHQATAAGIPIIAIDVPIDYPVACVIRSDDMSGAAAGAAYMVDRLRGRGKVAILRGGGESPVARLRAAGARQVFERYPDIRIVAETDRADWQRGQARAVVRELLSGHPDLRGVIAANDAMALGAIDVIGEVVHRDEIVVVGTDGDPDALLALQDGTLSATIRRSPYQMGRTAVEMAVALRRGEAVPPEVLLDDMTLVTAATVARTAIEALRIMPGIVDDLMTSSATLAAEREALRTLIDSLPDMIYMKDREGRFELANQMTARMLGVSSPEALIGKTDQDFFPADFSAEYRTDELRLLESGEALVDKEELLVDPSGVQHWIVTTKLPRRDHQGQLVGIIGRGQNITERKLAEQERQQLQEELIRAQALALEELSTPLIPISDRVLVMPLVGRIDTRRAGQIITTLLEGIGSQHAELAILDITGVSVVDTQVAHALIQAARAVSLLGARVVLTGLRPEVAQTLVSLGVDLSGIVTRSTLQSGIAYGLRGRKA